MRNYPYGYFLQTADINLADGPAQQNWIPIGDSDESFRGTFDGGGYTIENMRINDPDGNNKGLFGYLDSARVRNVALQNVTIQGNRYIGGLAGYVVDSFIENISVSGEITAFSDDAGGVIGYADENLFHHLSADVDLEGGQRLGGLIGNARHSEVRHSWSAGTVNGNRNVGGLIGGSWGLMVADSYSRADITAESRAGGLIGSLSGRVYRTYSTGRITADTDTQVGGLIGSTGTTASFGFNSFWDTQTSGQQISAGGEGVTGLDTQDMQQQAAFAPFNFYSLWEVDEGIDYPVFQDLQNHSLPQETRLSELSGSGTLENPYLVTSADELNAIHQNPAAAYRLDSDIDLTGTVIWNHGKGWQAIGLSGEDTAFTGSLDGNGYRIIGLAINCPESEDQGLFGYAENAVFENITLVQAHVHGNDNTGGLAGSLKESEAEYISVSGQIVSSYDNIGGVIGYADENLFHHLSADVDLEGDQRLGGLIGNARHSEVRHSWSAGTVNGNRNVGGLIGGSWGLMVADSYSRADITAESRAGGLIGSLSGRVYRTYSTGRITADTDTQVGGLIGSTGTTASFGFNSFWDTQTSGQQVSAGGDGVTGLDTQDMQQQAAFAPFNFYSLWEVDEGIDYPVFQDLQNHSLPQETRLSELSGSGTLENPYLVTSADELNAIHQNPAAAYRLDSDIDLTGTVIWNHGKGWQAIGLSGEDTAFTGSLDGNGYRIIGLAINCPESEDQGLFGYAENAVFENITLVQAHVHGNDNTGGLAGSLKESEAEYISVSGQIVSSYDNIGGVIGYADESTFSYMASLIDLFGDGRLGGIIGNMRNSNMQTSHASGRVQGDTRAGGLVGISSSIEIFDSYSHVDVIAESRSGGLIGGLGGKVYRSYSTGLVDGSGSNLGGFAGTRGSTASEGILSYWNTELSRQSESAGGDGVKGKTTEEMTWPHDNNVYEEWDFDQVWMADDGHSGNNGYPVLRQNAPIPTGSMDCNDERDLPGRISLEQNYPNPFNPATRITFTLPETADVLLEVYDVLGRLVAVLVSEQFQAGRHTVDFDASGLASGVYISRLQVSGLSGSLHLQNDGNATGSRSGAGAATSRQVLTRTMTLVK